MADGGPGLLIDPSCTVLARGLEGGFAYKRVRTAHGEMFEDKPDKGRFSHVCEALEYMLYGCGEARSIQGKRKLAEAGKAVNIRSTLDPFSRIRKPVTRNPSALRR
jgi:hypothetical protein